MTISQHQRAVGIFSHWQEAQDALHALRDAGFPLQKVSLVAQQREDRPHLTESTHTHEASDGAAAGAITGGFVGGLVGIIGTLSALTVPGIGPIVVGGATASLLANTLAGGAIGAATGGLVGGLAGLGIPEDRAKFYSDRVSRGDYLLMVDGTEAEIRQAETILNRRGIQDWGIYPTANTYGGAGLSNAYQSGRHQRAVGIFPNRQAAEDALQELKQAGFNLNLISVIARDAGRTDAIAGVDVQDRMGSKADEGAATGALTGGALGGITGLLVGLGTLALPGIGPVLLVGAEATALATTLAGAGIGAAAGGLIGALIGLGIPEDRAKVYSDRVSRGDYLILVNGTEDEIRHAEAILNSRGIEEWGVYDHPAESGIPLDNITVPAPGVNPTTTTTSYDPRWGVNRDLR